jgi:hypothetical protein
MERKHKNENDERNTNTSPTHIKGKDVNQANQTNSGAGGSEIKEGSNNPAENAKRTETPEKDKEHRTQQDQERYKGSNADGMNTEINKKDE